MRASVHVCTHRSATHRTNEDRAVAGATVIASTEAVEHTVLELPTVVAVLDGLGGHPAGDVASDLAARLLADADPPQDEDAIITLLERADQALHAAARDTPSHYGMGTTVALLALPASGTDVLVANIGDSSVFVLAAGLLTELSTSDRSLGGAILQCLGAFDESPVTPHVQRLEVAVDDRFLLASDGLTDVVPRDVMEAALRSDVDQGAAHLLALVDAAGSPDDVTIIVVEMVEG